MAGHSEGGCLRTAASGAILPKCGCPPAPMPEPAEDPGSGPGAAVAGQEGGQEATAGGREGAGETEGRGVTPSLAAAHASTGPSPPPL